MAARILQGNPDCDDILGWLDAHSVTLAQGIPAHLLHAKWEQADRPPARLGACLQLLFEQDWIVLTPGLEPPHLRFSPEGYRRLLAAPLVVPAAATWPEPVPEAPLPELLDDTDEDAVQADRRYLRHGEPLTELALRNEVLSIYRDLRLKAEDRLIGVTLSRYWQESGLRSGDLRLALDVLLRDGYLRQRLDGMDRYWVLTPDGERYLLGTPTPDALLRLAPPATALTASPETDELRRLALHAWIDRELGTGQPLDYALLLDSWQRTGLDQNALLHGLDLLLKGGQLELVQEQPPQFALTATGAEYARHESAGLARLLSRLSRALG